MTPADAQAFLDENFAPWVLALSPTVTEVSDQGATLEIPITADIARVGNIVSGQTLAALADTAMVIGGCASIDALEPLATTTLDTQFMRPATGERITAVAETIRAGRSMIFARCTLVAQPSGKPVAHATATLMRP